MFKYALKNIRTGKYVTKYITDDGSGTLYEVLAYDHSEVHLESDTVLFEMILNNEATGSYYLEVDLITPDYKDLRIIPIPFP